MNPLVLILTCIVALTMTACSGGPLAKNFAADRWLKERQAALAEAQAGNNEKALTAYLKALKSAESIGPGPELTNTYYELAGIYENLRDDPQTLTYYQKYVAAADPKQRSTNGLFIHAWWTIARIQMRSGDLAGAGESYKQLMAAERRSINAPNYALAMREYAAVLRKQGRSAEAAKLMERAHEGEAFDVEGVESDWQKFIRFAEEDVSAKKWKQAEEDYEQARKIVEPLHDFHLAQVAGMIGDVYLGEGNYKKAQTEYLKEIKLLEEQGTTYSADYVQGACRLAKCYRLAGKNADAAAQYKRAVDVARRVDQDQKTPDSAKLLSDAEDKLTAFGHHAAD
jgi:tetratricopeptide (TPR) repeat protein